MEPKIYIISDSIGETAKGVVQAAVSQFSTKMNIEKYSNVKSEDEVLRILGAARQDAKCLVAYTLVNSDLARALKQHADDAGIPVVDILGPTLGAIGQLVEEEPKRQAGLLHKLDEKYFNRVEAMEFTVKFDDRNDSKGIMQADVVLTGVSRTSKTPMSIYLAYRGLKVANIPLVPEVKPPDALFENPGGKVVGLTIAPLLLNEIRLERLRCLGLDTRSEYASIQRINEELSFAEEIMARVGCPIVDVTNRSIEESANEVLRLIGR